MGRADGAAADGFSLRSTHPHMHNIRKKMCGAKQ
jgi:hypothetical protein